MHLLYGSSLRTLQQVLDVEVPASVRDFMTRAVITAHTQVTDHVPDESDPRTKALVRVVFAIDHLCHVVNPEDVMIDGKPGLIMAANS